MCVSAYCRTLVTDVSKFAVLTEVGFFPFFLWVSMFCPTLSYRCVKVALLIEVVFMFSVCFSVLSNSVLPMCPKLPY